MARLILRGTIWGFVSAFLLLAQPSYADSTRYVDAETGVQIVWVTEPDMFPKEWSSEPVNVEVSPLPQWEIERSVKVIRFAMQKYSASVLKTHLERVYVVRYLAFSGVPVGGTKWWNRIYIANNGITQGYTNNVLEESFHHEFSHILLHT